jgi:hypothetical protein
MAAAVPKIPLNGAILPPANEGRNSRHDSRSNKLNKNAMSGQGGGGPKAIDPERKGKLRKALVRKLLTKYHPGISNSKTEKLIEQEVDRLMNMDKVSEDVLHEVEARVRKQSNDEIAYIVTNPFKNVTSFKSGARDEWAAMNDMIVKVRPESN